jgi:hypothetical protein
MIFDRDDYKDVLKSVLLERKASLGTRATFQKMAQACRVEKAYLSRVLNGTAHLSSDQLYMACRFLELSPVERRYVGLLHQHQRSALQRHKDELQVEIKALRKTQLRTDGHICARKAAMEGSTELAEYFLDPNAQLIHMFLTTTRYQDDLASIGRCLGLSPDAVAVSLGRLERAGIVALRDGRYRVVETNLHLPPDSPFFRPYRQALRLRSTERLGVTAPEDAYSVSVVFSTTPAVRKQIHEEFLQLLKRVETLLADAPEEEVYQMNFDLFAWSDEGRGTPRPSQSRRG